MVQAYGLSPSAQENVAAASTIAKEVLAQHAAEVDTQGRFPAEGIKALADAGFYGLGITKEAGGKGEGMRGFAGVVEELAGACASTAMIYVMHVSAAQAIAVSSILGERDSILKETAAGKHLTTLAFSERGSRSQFWIPISKLEERNGHYVTSAWPAAVTQDFDAEVT